MTGIASKSQLRMSFLRYALFTVPAVLLLGTLSGLLSGSGADNPWFEALEKRRSMPPGWVFGVGLDDPLHPARPVAGDAAPRQGREAARQRALALFALQLAAQLRLVAGLLRLSPGRYRAVDDRGDDRCGLSS